MTELAGFLTPTRRRTLLTLAAGLTRRRRNGNHDRDQALLFACSEFNRIERLKLALLEGPDRIADDDERDECLLPLEARQLPFLDIICDARATTLTAHRARAATFMLWDGGELAWRAANNNLREDRLLNSLLRDLLGDKAAVP